MPSQTCRLTARRSFADMREGRGGIAESLFMPRRIMPPAKINDAPLKAPPDMGMTPKSQPPASISPRLQGYLTTAEEPLQDRTKAPSQHAAARRIRDAILGQSKRVPAGNLLSPKPKQQEPVAALELPFGPSPTRKPHCDARNIGTPNTPRAKDHRRSRPRSGTIWPGRAGQYRATGRSTSDPTLCSKLISATLRGAFAASDGHQFRSRADTACGQWRPGVAADLVTLYRADG